jgi:hypothetical protein
MLTLPFGSIEHDVEQKTTRSAIADNPASASKMLDGSTFIRKGFWILNTTPKPEFAIPLHWLPFSFLLVRL